MNMKKLVLLLLTLALVLVSTAALADWHYNDCTDPGKIAQKKATCTERGWCRHESTADAPGAQQGPDGKYFIEYEIEALGHDFQFEKSLASEHKCADLYKCSRCGATEERPVAHTYEWHETGDVLIPCQDKGHLEEVCAVCGHKSGNVQETEPKPHKFMVKVVESEANCVEPEHFHMECEVCGAADKSQTTGDVDPEIHDFGSLWIEKDSTCTEEGKGYRICNRCKARFEEVIEKKPHSFTVKVVDKEPTCTDTGSYHMECDVCGAEDRAVEIPALGHLPSATPVTVKDPTCTEEGLAIYTCERVIDGVRCNAEVDRLAIAPLGHSFVVPQPDKKAPTCVEPGIAVKLCIRCGAEHEEEIPALGHDWGEWQLRNPATESSLGYWLRTCNRCEATDVRIEDDNGDYVKEENIKDATCTTPGTKDIVTYDINGNELTRETVVTAEALGHEWVKDEENSVAATCETAGKTVMKCTRCGETEEEEVAALGHDMQVVAESSVPASCEVAGNIVKKCSRCDKTEVTAIPALGHDMKDAPELAVAPTCETAGKTVKKCSRCDKTEETVVAATGHKLTAVAAKEPTASTCGNKAYDVCETCGKMFIDGVEVTLADVTVNANGGLAKDADGKFKFFGEDGKVNTNYTGMTSFEGGMFFVRDGVLDTSVNGVQSPLDGNWYFFANGQVQTGYTGLAEYDGQWFVVNQGKFSLGYNGLYDWNGGTFWVAAGQKTHANGLVETEKGWMYFEDGCLIKLTGLKTYDGGIFYVKDGVMQKDFTGTVKDQNGTEFNVVNGMVK